MSADRPSVEVFTPSQCGGRDYDYLGAFHGWGVKSVGGAPAETHAIVVDQDGNVSLVPPSLVRFIP